MKSTMAVRRIGSLLLILVLVMSLAVPCMAAQTNAISEARNGVVRILAIDPSTGYGVTGSGFGVGKAGEETDYFITNWHVITSSGEYKIGELEIYILLSNDAVTETADGLYIDPTETIQCQVIYSADQYPDVAILKAARKVPGRVALVLRSAREVAIASQVYSLGYPAAADIATVSQAETAYKYADVDSVHINGGVVSKLSSFELFGNTYCLEHDAHINNGNSGGPLVDENGCVVGINTYGVSTDDFLNYSVYIDYAMGYLNELGIDYDYVGGEDPDPFPVVPVAVGAAVVVILAVVVLVVLKKRKPAETAPVDTGLRVQFSPDAMLSSKRYVINGTLRFGRAPDCNILYGNNAPGISSHHCEIVVEQGQVYIRDLNSTYGTFVNGSRIPANQPVPLHVGTTVSLGSTKESFQIVKSTKVGKG